MPKSGPKFYTRNQASKCVVARIRRHLQPISEHFYLRDFGSWKAAEDAAKQWVENNLPNAPDPIPVKDRMTVRNTSGIVGVQLKRRTVNRSGSRNGSDSWQANWPGCPNPGGVTWAVEKYGDDQAFVRAALARELETIDRDQIEREFEKTVGTKKYRSILAKKHIDGA